MVYMRHHRSHQKSCIKYHKNTETRIHSRIYLGTYIYCNDGVPSILARTHPPLDNHATNAPPPHSHQQRNVRPNQRRGCGWAHAGVVPRQDRRPSRDPARIDKAARLLPLRPKRRHPGDRPGRRRQDGEGGGGIAVARPGRQV